MEDCVVVVLQYISALYIIIIPTGKATRIGAVPGITRGVLGKIAVR